MEFWKNIHWQEEEKSSIEWKNILTEEEFSKREGNILEISDNVWEKVWKILWKKRLCENFEWVCSDDFYKIINALSDKKIDKFFGNIYTAPKWKDILTKKEFINRQKQIKEIPDEIPNEILEKFNTITEYFDNWKEKDFIEKYISNSIWTTEQTEQKEFYKILDNLSHQDIEKYLDKFYEINSNLMWYYLSFINFEDTVLDAYTSWWWRAFDFLIKIKEKLDKNKHHLLAIKLDWYLERFLFDLKKMLKYIDKEREFLISDSSYAFDYEHIDDFLDNLIIKYKNIINYIEKNVDFNLFNLSDNLKIISKDYEKYERYKKFEWKKVKYDEKIIKKTKNKKGKTIKKKSNISKPYKYNFSKIDKILLDYIEFMPTESNWVIDIWDSHIWIISTYWLINIFKKGKNKLKKINEKDFSSFLFENKNFKKFNAYKNLMSIDVMKYLYNELWINILKININSQLELTNFISWNSNNYEMLKNSLNQNQQIKYQILESFLSASENPKFAEIILNIADSKILSDSEKKLIFEKYWEISENIENLSEKIFKHYKKILPEKDRETKISQNEIRKNFIEHAWDLFEEIFEDLRDWKINLEKIFDEFEKFDLETVWIFDLIEELNLSEIEDLQFKWIPKLCSKKISHKEMKEEFENNSDLSKQVKNILTEKFSEKDFNAFENDFLEDKSSEIFTLKNWKNILYMVWTRILDDKNNKWEKIKYIDWLANSPKLWWFNLKLTENFLKNELNLNKKFWDFQENKEFSDKEDNEIKKIEALWEPEILTSFLFIEKFWFIINWTSDTPESWKYWEEWDFFKLEKNFSNWEKKFLAKEKNLDELKILESEWKIFTKEFLIPDENEKILESANKAKDDWYCISRFIQLEKIGKIEKDDKNWNKNKNWNENNDKKLKNSQKRILCAFEKLESSKNNPNYLEDFPKAA